MIEKLGTFIYSICLVAFAVLLYICTIAFIPCLVYFVMGLFVDDQSWRMAFALVAFAAVLFGSTTKIKVS